MLDEVRPKLDASKAKDIVQRLSSDKPEQAIACEMELALLWGMQQISDLIIEPEIPGSSRRPEAFSNEFFEKPAYIEVTALSDGGLSGQENMNRASQKIAQFANTVSKGFGNYLYFTFQEVSKWERGVFNRSRRITHDFELDDALKGQISIWVQNHLSGEAPVHLHLSNGTIGVVIERKQVRQKQGYNYFSSMPAVAYNLKNNPLYKALKAKETQLSGIANDSLKVVFVADGGSRLLRLLSEKDPQNLQKSGSEIIQYFLSTSSIDIICIFSPYRKPSLYPHLSDLSWKVSPFFRNSEPASEKNLEKLTTILPKPKFEGYQARSLQEQGAFSSLENNWYLGYKITTSKDMVTMRVSARLLQEYLAGRLSKDEFERNAFSDKNLFNLWLQQGHTIKNVQFESIGLDEDDDYVVFEFSKDPAASLFDLKIGQPDS